MRLITKLTLFITLSKMAIVLFFVLILPFLVERIASNYTNYYLDQQQKKVMKIIAKDGIDFYLEGGENYGSYTMLKEEYIALERTDTQNVIDTILTARRVVELDTLNYRVLMRTFKSGDTNYLLEIGKTTATISQYNRPMQRIALIVLIGLILFTLIIDLGFTRFLLRPLGKIIKSKLINRKFPFKDNISSVRTSTSDFKYLDDSLILLMDQIHEAFEKEREFTANASHELMTPISILQSKIENLMEEAGVGETIQHRLMEMQRTLNRLKKIVRSLLLISRIENAQFARSETVNIKDLIEDVLEDISHRMEEKDITFEMNLHDDNNLQLVNRDLLFQLLYNLINNAIKYNKEKGTIHITGKRSKTNGYELVLEDTGIGIPREDIPVIFNRFRKANPTEGGGYGLGLSIVKSISDYHNIRITVSSDINTGTKFTLVFSQDMLVK
ncbi:MAG TPA: HAMP domain-containing sensor histidine kinase [Sphingobacteriaceae bacterium]|nr:HAMP domain-containing sensor histidine kinase [Sphingobacteriaceae bacterium]